MYLLCLNISSYLYIKKYLNLLITFYFPYITEIYMNLCYIFESSIIKIK